MTEVTKSRPPPHTVELRRWSLVRPDDLRSLRRSLDQVLAELGPTGDEVLAEVFERIVLVATELATNALQHGLPPTTVRLLRHDDRLVLDVADHDRHHAPVDTAAALADHRGRGLPIARAMSLDIGWYPAGDAKHVWASFAIETEP
uniref:ATP-binding protein n=1 Tax=Paractinoplanes polyasparticus TaxID=2856853 RepID=UPI001C847C60|nr:ATP-binding protein [Actinoplanes polyasparticus]